MAGISDKGAKHITSLDFDISHIAQQLEEVKKTTEKYSLEIGKTFTENINKSMNTATGADGTSSDKGILGDTFNEQQFKQAEDKIKRLSNTYADFSKDVSTYNVETGEKFKESITISEDVGKKITTNYQQVGKEFKAVTQVITIDNEKRQKALEKAYQKEQSELEKAQKIKDNFYKKNSTQIDIEIQERQRQSIAFASSLKSQMELSQKAQEQEQAELEKAQKLKENFYKKNATQIDTEIKERERQSQAFASSLKAQMELAQKEDVIAKKQIANLEAMIVKQKQFTNMVSGQKTTSINKQIIADSKMYTQSMQEMLNTIKQTGKITSEQQTSVNDYSNKIKELSGHYEDAGTKGQSFLSKIGDKAKWLGAFYVVNELRQGLVAAVRTIKDTEDAVVQLQRVLNEDIGQTELSSQLYKLASDYGRSFADVQEVAVKFAQTGADWNDVIKLTQSTMLALNTAELDVTQSTEGLIAIMSQWKIEAQDMESVIDKINITADKFTVTSEKIVTALQRASGTAKNANLSLEETIGIITALSTATGRSGENIGTAINSLLIYTTKSKALETFAQIGDEGVDKALEAYKTGAGSILSVWTELSRNIKNLNEEQQAILYQGIGGDTFAEELETNASGITDQIKEIYGTAGTYRQNYFIALLEELATAQEATANLTNATGYSAKENEKYMETLSAQFEQLKIALQQLAVQLGEAGLMDLIKGLVSGATGIAKITQNIGGLLPVLTLFSVLLVNIKAQKINDYWKSVSASMKIFWTDIGKVNTALKATNSTGNKFVTVLGAIKTAGVSLSSVLSVLGVGFAIFTMVSSKINEINQKKREEREELIATTQARLEETAGLSDLISQYERYNSMQNKTEEEQTKLNSVTDELNKLLGINAESFDTAGQSAENYSEKLRETVVESTKSSLAEIDLLIKNTKDAFKDIKPDISFDMNALRGASQEIKDIITSTFKDYGAFFIQGDMKFMPASKDFEGIKQYNLALTEIKDALDEIAKTQFDLPIEERIGSSEYYQNLVNALKEIEPKMADVLQSEYKSYRAMALINNTIPKTVEEFELYKQVLFDSLGVNESLRDEVDKLANDDFPSLAKGADTAGEAIAKLSVSADELKNLKTAFDELNQSIDNTQSGLNVVYDAMNEYNEQKFISIDTTQTLLSQNYEYIELLNFTKNGITLNEEALAGMLDKEHSVIEALIDNAEAQAILDVIQQHLKISTENVGISAENASGKIDMATDAVHNLVNSAIQGTTTMDTFWNALEQNKEQFRDYNKMISEIVDIQKNFDYNIRANFGKSIYNDVTKWSSSASKAVESATKKSTDAQKKMYDAQKEKLNEQKQAIKERYDKEIEGLKAVEKQNDKIAKQEDYRKRKRDAEKDVELAKVRTGMDYREQQSQAEQTLQDIEKDWQDTVVKWSIDDKIKELEDLRDKEIKAIEIQITAIEKAMKNIATTTVAQSSNANKQMLKNTKLDLIEPVVKANEQANDKISKNGIASAKATANSMFSMHKEFFLMPFETKLKDIQGELLRTKEVLNTPTFFQRQAIEKYPFAKRQSNNNTTYNNSNSNANVYANIYGENQASSFGKSIFTKP